MSAWSINSVELVCIIHCSSVATGRIIIPLSTFSSSTASFQPQTQFVPFGEQCLRRDCFPNDEQPSVTQPFNDVHFMLTGKCQKTPDFVVTSGYGPGSAAGVPTESPQVSLRWMNSCYCGGKHATRAKSQCMNRQFQRCQWSFLRSAGNLSTAFTTGQG